MFIIISSRFLLEYLTEPIAKVFAILLALISKEYNKYYYFINYCFS